jgi:spermidine synthase
MELWYSEQHTKNVRFSVKVNQHLYTAKSEFQRIDVFKSKEFGTFLTLDGLIMVTERMNYIP